MSEEKFTPSHLNHKEMVLKYFTVIDIEAFAEYLALSQLENTEYESAKDFYSEYESRKNSFSSLIHNQVLAGNFSVCYSDEVRGIERGNDVDGIELDYKRVKVQCIKIAEFADWAKKNDFECPKIILDRAPGESGSSMVSPAIDNTKVVDGLLKMVIAMAMDCYGYNPTDEKSTVTADIKNALETRGLSLSDNTIRNRLKQAATYLPREESKKT